MLGCNSLFAAIDKAIAATGQSDEYFRGMCNGMLFVKSLIDGKKPEYFSDAAPTREEMIIAAIDKMISATGIHSEGDAQYCNGLLYVKSLLTNKGVTYFSNADITPPPKRNIVGPFDHDDFIKKNGPALTWVRDESKGVTVTG